MVLSDYKVMQLLISLAQTRALAQPSPAIDEITLHPITARAIQVSMLLRTLGCVLSLTRVDYGASIPVVEIASLVTSLVLGNTEIDYIGEALDAIVVSVIGLHVVRECLHLAPVAIKLWCDIAGAANLSSLLLQCARWAAAASPQSLTTLSAYLSAPLQASQQTDYDAFVKVCCCELLQHVVPWQVVSSHTGNAAAAAVHVTVACGASHYVNQCVSIMDDQVSLHAPPQPADDAVPEPQSSQQPAVNTVLRLSDGVCDPLWSNALVQPAAQQCEVLLSVVASLLATFYVSDVEDDTSKVDADARMRRLFVEALSEVFNTVASIDGAAERQHVQRMALLMLRCLCAGDAPICADIDSGDVWTLLFTESYGLPSPAMAAYTFSTTLSPHRVRAWSTVFEDSEMMSQLQLHTIALPLHDDASAVSDAVVVSALRASVGRIWEESVLSQAVNGNGCTAPVAQLIDFAFIHQDDDDAVLWALTSLNRVIVAAPDAVRGAITDTVALPALVALSHRHSRIKSRVMSTPSRPCGAVSADKLAQSALRPSAGGGRADVTPTDRFKDDHFGDSGARNVKSIDDSMMHAMRLQAGLLRSAMNDSSASLPSVFSNEDSHSQSHRRSRGESSDIGLDIAQDNDEGDDDVSAVPVPVPTVLPSSAQVPQSSPRAPAPATATVQHHPVLFTLARNAVLRLLELYLGSSDETPRAHAMCLEEALITQRSRSLAARTAQIRKHRVMSSDSGQGNESPFVAVTTDKSNDPLRVSLMEFLFKLAKVSVVFAAANALPNVALTG